MIFCRKIVFYIFIAMVFYCQSSFAISDEIKIFVGREIITEHDINEKIDMIVFLNKIDRNALTGNKKVVQDLATTMINEKLVAKYAKKHNIGVRDLESAIKNKAIKKEVLVNFVKTELMMKEIVSKSIYPKLRSSKFSKDLFVEKLYEKMQKNSGEYRMYQYTKINTNDIALINKINDMKIESCRQIESIKMQFGLREVLVNNYKIDELNTHLRNILMMHSGNKGLFAYIDDKDINIIGFCQVKVATITSIEQKKIDELYENNQFSVEIGSFYRKIINNNAILIKN